MKYCETCESEMKTRSFAFHLFTFTLKIGLGLAIIAGIFGGNKSVDFAVSLILIIPYLSLVLYPFKFGVVHICTNKDCKDTQYENIETFSCGSCDSEDNVKRKKKTTKITLVGVCLVIVAYFIPMDYYLMSIKQILFMCGLGINIFAVVLEKTNAFDVILKCKNCGKAVIVKKEKVKEYGL
ncbi:hypothetical protein JY742_18495 [Clostridioides difficile]|nr:hypothetical protein [Clostridioides difficile]